MKQKIHFLLILLFLSVSISAQNQEDSSAEKISTVAKQATDFAQYNKLRIGGYGEMTASYLDYGVNRFTPTGSVKDSRGTISIPRFILALDYKFSSSWVLGVEIEFEYGGTGVAREIDWVKESGEYELEVEKGGEVALEQFHITRLFHPSFNVRAGHMIVPVGLINAYHEPIHFFGVYRPEGEATILPSTWHENGLSFFGEIATFDYEVMIVAGLDPLGFSKTEWIAGGQQKMYEISTFTSPAFAGRLNYHGVKNLRLGISGYYNQSAKNTARPGTTSGLKNTVNIISADAQYRNRHLTARASFTYGTLGESEALSKINRRLSSSSGYPRTDVASAAMSYGAEVGYNIGSFFPKECRIYPFLRYEYYNPMEKTQGSVLADKRLETVVITGGVNYYALPNLVVKAEYSNRQIGGKGSSYQDENSLSIGLAYIGWFLSK